MRRQASSRPLVLIVHRAGRPFAQRDERLLSEFVDVRRVEVRAVSAIVESIYWAWRSDAVLSWFASAHAVLPGLVAKLRRRPFAIIPGGYEVASVVEVGYGWPTSPIRRRFAKVLLRTASSVIAVSPSISDLIRAAAPGVIPVLIPNAAEPPTHTALPPDQRRYDVATSIATSSEVARRLKGIDLLLRAALLLPERTFLIVGDLSDQPTPKNVTVTGFLPQHQAEALLGEARVYVQASRGYEAFGSAIIEAMLREVAPVVTEVGGMPWVVGDTGVVVREGSGEHLAVGIEEALTSGSGVRARQRALARFSTGERTALLLEALGVRPTIYSRLEPSHGWHNLWCQPWEQVQTAETD